MTWNGERRGRDRPDVRTAQAVEPLWHASASRHWTHPVTRRGIPARSRGVGHTIASPRAVTAHRTMTPPRSAQPLGTSPMNSKTQTGIQHWFQDGNQDGLNGPHVRDRLAVQHQREAELPHARDEEESAAYWIRHGRKHKRDPRDGHQDVGEHQHGQRGRRRVLA